MQGRFDNGYSSSGSNNYSSSGSGGYPTSSNYGSSIGGSVPVPTPPQQYVDVSSTGPVVPSANSYSSTYSYPQTQTSSNLFGGYNARVRAQHANQQVVDSKYEHCCTIV